MKEYEMTDTKANVEELLGEPRSVPETGLSPGFLSDMAIKMLYGDPMFNPYEPFNAM